MIIVRTYDNFRNKAVIISYNNPAISYKMVGLLLLIQDFLIIFALEIKSN